jgi:DivIVA domain-containing protein
MPVLPEEITRATFRRRFWRGYQPTDVATFLDRVASDYAGAIESVAREATRTPEQLTQAREQAAAETAQAREQAQHTAEAIIRHAEHSAHAINSEIDALRAQARADAAAARARLEEADNRARQLEDVARQRWDALCADTEHRWQRVAAADRRLDDRVRQLERALAALRSRAALLDQLSEVEDLMATIRTETRPDWTHPDPNGRA